MGDDDSNGGDITSNKGAKKRTELNPDDVVGGGNPDDNSGGGDVLPDLSPKEYEDVADLLETSWNLVHGHVFDDPVDTGWGCLPNESIADK
uniref:Uncharacterized protein n=1 Tax=Sphaerodactylus townsendi TaxID=933632 RepID=A0ACB8G385_9SAUR